MSILIQGGIVVTADRRYRVDIYCENGTQSTKNGGQRLICR